ncbi:uncharacterized protein METZ01_LOCUS228500, partial [marine metagenome]
YNNPPVADDLSVTTDEDTSVDITLTGSDPEGDELTYEVTSGPSNGSLTGDASELTYMPNADFNGNDSFTFNVSDGELFDEGTVSITVNAVNDAPVLTAIGTQSTDEDTPLTITLFASDADDDVLAFEAESDNDAVTIFVDGDQLMLTPSLNYFGTANIMVTVSDGFLSDSDTFELIINSVNDAGPVVTVPGGPFETPEETALAIDIVVSDIDGDLAVLSVVGDPLHGTGDMVDNGGGSYTYTYTPSDGYVGTDAVIIQAQETETEEQLYSDQVNIQITVIEVNDPPEAEDDSVELSEDGSVDITLWGDDEDTPDDSLSIEIVDSPIYGTLEQFSGRVLDTYTYTPDPDYNGDDSFTYRVFDGDLYSEFATITLTITPVNDAPTAESDLVDAEGNIEVSFDMSTLIGDIESDDSTLVIDLILDGGAQGGTVTIDGTVLTYNQAGNTYDHDYIPYRVSDGELNSSVEMITIYNMPGSERQNRDAPLAIGDTVEV